MAIPEKVKKAADRVRAAIYGGEVQESIASGLEAAGEVAEESNGRSKNTEVRQTKVEKDFQTLQQEYTENGNGAQTSAEITLARDGEPVLADRLKRDFGNVNAQLEQNAKHTSDEVIVAKSFGLIPNLKTLEAATINTQILNDLLNRHNHVRIDGIYYVNDINVITHDRTLTIEGDFTLNNFAVENHLLNIEGRIHHSGSMFLNGFDSMVNGLVLNNINGSIFGKIRVCRFKKYGVVAGNTGNSNSVVIDYLRTELNGTRHVSDVTIVSKDGANYTQSTKISIKNPIDAKMFDSNTIKGLIIGSKFYEVTNVANELDSQVLNIRPNLPEAVGNTVLGAEILIGGGIFFDISADTNWWNINNFVTTDYTVGMYNGSLFGHNINNMLIETPRVGVIIGTVRENFNALFNHVYIEDAITTFPFVTYRGYFSIIEPLYNYTTATLNTVYHLYGEDLDLSKVSILSGGKFYSNSKTHLFQTAATSKDLSSGETLVINRAATEGSYITINLKKKNMSGYTVKDVAVFIYDNDHTSTGTWNKNVVFVPEIGYTVNGISEKTYVSTIGEKYVFYAYLIGTNWTVSRFKTE